MLAFIKNLAASYLCILQTHTAHWSRMTPEGLESLLRTLQAAAPIGARLSVVPVRACDVRCDPRDRPRVENESFWIRRFRWHN